MSTNMYETQSKPTTNGVNGTHYNDQESGARKGQVNAWSTPGPAAYDFRSDTITTPIASMLTAISNTTLMDDVFCEDPTTNSLEADIAALAGHEAAVLVMSGSMGNQVALRSHLMQPPHSILCDYRAHILNYEAGGASVMSGAMVLGIKPSNGIYLTLQDIEENAILSDDIHACPTRVISLENTLRGTVMPLSEVKKISAFAHSHDIKLHLDGARLWEAAASGAGSLSDYGSLFDSVSLCFSKGLGAPMGSMLVGSKPFITQSRRIRKMMGGGTRQAGIISAAARVAVEENFGHGPNGEGGKLQGTHARARHVAQLWQSKGGQVSHPVETNMVWVDLAAAGCSSPEWLDLCAKEGLKVLGGGRLIVHYQICDEAIEKLERVMDKAIKKKSDVDVNEKGQFQQPSSME